MTDGRRSVGRAGTRERSGPPGKLGASGAGGVAAGVSVFVGAGTAVRLLFGSSGVVSGGGAGMSLNLEVDDEPIFEPFGTESSSPPGIGPGTGSGGGGVKPVAFGRGIFAFAAQGGVCGTVGGNW